MVFAAIASSTIVAVLAAGVGAYVGAYVGAMVGAMIEARMSASPALDELVRHAVHHETRDSGVLVAVHVSLESQSRAAETLSRAGCRPPSAPRALEAGPLGRLRPD